MTPEARASLARAGRDLQAARHLSGGGFTDQAISRAYYAAFHAAEACLLELAERRSKHAATIVAFVRLVVKEGGFDPEIGRVLRRLFDRRNEADYGAPDADRARADQAIDEARRFIDAAERWVAERDRA